eukprot:11749950-Ditylum_brightwellii.AAC.1
MILRGGDGVTTLKCIIHDTRIDPLGVNSIFVDGCFSTRTRPDWMAARSDVMETLAARLYCAKPRISVSPSKPFNTTSSDIYCDAGIGGGE